MLKCIATEHGVMLAFLKMLRGFCYKERETIFTSISPFESRTSEHLIGKLTFSPHVASGDKSLLTKPEFAYTLGYAERRHDHTIKKYHGKCQPWAIRKLALYHSYDPDKQRSTYMLISPNPKSRAEHDVVNWMARTRLKHDVYDNHFEVHDLLLSYHLDNWSPYMNYYGKQMDELVTELFPGG